MAPRRCEFSSLIDTVMRYLEVLMHTVKLFGDTYVLSTFLSTNHRVGMSDLHIKSIVIVTTLGCNKMHVRRSGKEMYNICISNLQRY